MHYTELIEKKRDGFTHTKEEIEFIIRGVTDGSMPDYQLTAWMMAVCFRGMTDEETAYLTDAMMHSGDVVDLSDLEGIKVDKHSTGGVGDTTTLIVAPLVAACGGTVAKVSGRGLAHSGGTLDKLESVPGVSVEKSLDEFKRIVRKTGLCVIGQSGNLDPADKRMYALRDVSGTVPSIPLIASSIMSKKLASGAEAIVLDVKTGGGAFMRTVDEARKLASLMVKIGRHLGRNTVAVITDMDRPLGMAVGNGLEMREAIEGLTGKIPYNDPLMQVSFVLAGRLLMLSNIASTQEDAEIMLKKAVEDGSGFTRLRSMLEEMGGDVRYVDDPNLLVRTKRIVPIYKDCTGYIKKLDAKSIGLAALLLGAGREKAGDTVDPAVGILMKKRCGDRIEKDEPIAYMYVNDETNLDEAVSKLVNAVCVADEKPEDEALVYDIIE
ncbi:MAG: thymidine phosphorylase [Eubacteriales bacterium]|nr:thymidine phosphorylase [Eubacteriales bacterium]